MIFFVNLNTQSFCLFNKIFTIILKKFMLEYFFIYSIVIISLSVFVLHMTSNQWVKRRHKIFLTLIFYISFFPLSIIPLDLDL